MANMIADVIAREEERCAALVAKDAIALGALMSDDCIVLHGSGKVEGKNDFLSAVFDRLNIASIEHADRQVRIFGDCAVITSVMTMVVALMSEPENFMTTRANMTAVWNWSQGQWLLNTLHNTRLSQ